MPAWGAYPNGESYDGTRPLGRHAAWLPQRKKPAVLTWVQKFPVSACYFLWVRCYGGYTKISVSIDEELQIDVNDFGGTKRYVWKEIGRMRILGGRHHVDIEIKEGMFDAILFSLSESFDPGKDLLPQLTRNPEIRALRTYRDASHLEPLACDMGFVIGSLVPYQEILYDWVPQKERLIDELKLWGAPGQYLNATFAVRAVKEIAKLQVHLPELVGPGGLTLDMGKIDLRVVHLRKRKIDLFEKKHENVLVPELLLRDDRTELPPTGIQGGLGGGSCVTRIPGHQSRQFWLTVHIPEDYPSGKYEGDLILANGSGESTTKLPVALEILPLKLKVAEGYYSIFYPSQPVNSKKRKFIDPDRYLAELQDQVRHGLNTTTLYGGFATLHYAHKAGMTKSPCLMHWPDQRAPAWVDEARKIGFEGLLFYGVDEPKTNEQISRNINEAKRRQRLGLSMLTAINSRKAYLATRDTVDHPAYNIYVFSGKENDAISYALQRGFKPISYWTTSTTFPLYYRALAGLYNKSCGFVGCMPWSYQDFPDERLYDSDKPGHKMTYPDELGQPIPTLCWEAHRDGIDDVRYLETLDRAIARADAQIKSVGGPKELRDALIHARQIRKEHFENIKGRWFEYLCTVRPGYLDTVRRSFADATVMLTEFLHSDSAANKQ